MWRGYAEIILNSPDPWSAPTSQASAALVPARVDDSGQENRPVLDGDDDFLAPCGPPNRVRYGVQNRRRIRVTRFGDLLRVVCNRMVLG